MKRLAALDISNADQCQHLGRRFCKVENIRWERPLVRAKSAGICSTMSGALIPILANFIVAGEEQGRDGQSPDHDLSLIEQRVTKGIAC